ncbi:probable G-protein coupled receptor Mth-like 6 isoform X1 [Drosophila montana]|uniref:probable G-protein coupled receptor Mth-like 6 isoform X1 n=1 Tax=Drosophila montana TaxID=40370 RepID=UPI00313ED0BE
MAGFLWLTVISLNLWNGLRGKKVSFMVYSLYVWGIAALLTGIVILVDNILDSDNDQQLAWMPGVSIYNCWLKTDDWSAMQTINSEFEQDIFINKKVVHTRIYFSTDRSYGRYMI